MTLTPHVIRRSDIQESDLRSFLVGGEASPFLFEVPAQTPRRCPRARAAAAEPIRRIEPIRPPAAEAPPPDGSPSNREARRGSQGRVPGRPKKLTVCCFL